MKALGRHFILELSQCNPDLLSNQSIVETTLVEAANQANTQVLKVASHKFSPQGISAVVVIAESHLSIHTWPEERYAAADIFTCGETADPQKACDYLALKFEAQQVKMTIIQRGLKDTKNNFTHALLTDSNIRQPSSVL